MEREFFCPECTEKFSLESYLDVGDIFDCPGCSVELKVVSLSPAEVETAYDSLRDDDEDMDEEDSDYDEDNKKEDW